MRLKVPLSSFVVIVVPLLACILAINYSSHGYSKSVETLISPPIPSVVLEPGPKGIFRLHGNADFKRSEIGSSINITRRGWAEFTPKVQLCTDSGTLAFWIFPRWNDKSINSNPMVSFLWDDPRNGYFAVSYGWWEPTGIGRLYFILNNQDFVHCSLPCKFVSDYWSLVTATWQNGKDGYCRLYIDGERVAESHKSFYTSFRPRGPVFLGTDKGTKDQRGRSCDALFGKVMLFDEALSDKQVMQLFKSQLKNPVAANEKKWKWLHDGLKLPLKETRTADGKLVETRAIFDEDIRWATSRDETDKILATIKQAGFNVYIPCVWHGKGTYFISSVARHDPRLTARISSGDDPLAYLVKKAHALGIEVHPWFTVVNRETDEYRDYYDTGTPDKAFNVHSDKFKNFIETMMLDMIRKYDIDGINLDYIRSMGICTSKACRDNYEKLIGYSFWTDYALRHINGKARNRLEKWQDDAVRNIVEVLAVHGKAIKPDLIISVDGHPKPKDKARPLEGRNEIDWLNKGLIDLIFAMDYRECIDYENIDKVRSELRYANKLIVIFGNYEKKDGRAVPRSGKLVADYAEYSRRKWPGSGVAFYLYWQITSEQTIALKNGPFKERAFTYIGNN